MILKAVTLATLRSSGWRFVDLLLNKCRQYNADCNGHRTNENHFHDVDILKFEKCKCETKL